MGEREEGERGENEMVISPNPFSPSYIFFFVFPSFFSSLFFFFLFLMQVLEQIIEQEKQHKSKYSWSATWNFLRLGAVYQMLNETGTSSLSLSPPPSPPSLSPPSSSLSLPLSLLIFVFSTAKSKQCYEWTMKEKATDRWPQDLKQQAAKFVKTGGRFAMFELMFLTGHYYKVGKER